jgi:hypothetical protein
MLTSCRGLANAFSSSSPLPSFLYLESSTLVGALWEIQLHMPKPLQMRKPLHRAVDKEYNGKWLCLFRDTAG